MFFDKGAAFFEKTFVSQRKRNKMFILKNILKIWKTFPTFLKNPKISWKFCFCQSFQVHLWKGNFSIFGINFSNSFSCSEIKNYKTIILAGTKCSVLPTFWGFAKRRNYLGNFSKLQITFLHKYKIQFFLPGLTQKPAGNHRPKTVYEGHTRKSFTFRGLFKRPLIRIFAPESWLSGKTYKIFNFELPRYSNTCFSVTMK